MIVGMTKIKRKRPIRLKTISIVVLIVLISLFFGLKEGISGRVLGLARYLALTQEGGLDDLGNVPDSQDGQEEDSAAAAEQFEGGESEGSSVGGGGAGAPDGGFDASGSVCDTDGNCSGEDEPAEPNMEEETGATEEPEESLATLEAEEALERSIETLSELVDRIENEDVEVASVDGFAALIQHEIAAIVNISLEVDPETMGLVTKTKNGIKKIDIFPDEAVENVLLANELTRVDIPQPVEAAQRSKTKVSNVVNLQVREDVPVYEIKGVKDHKLLGLIPVTTEAVIYVSAENGKTVAKKESAIAKTIDFISSSPNPRRKR